MRVVLVTQSVFFARAIDEIGIFKFVNHVRGKIITSNLQDRS